MSCRLKHPTDAQAYSIRVDASIRPHIVASTFFFRSDFFLSRLTLSLSLLSNREYAYQFFSWSLFLYIFSAFLTFAAFNLISFFFSVRSGCQCGDPDVHIECICFFRVQFFSQIEHASWIIIFMPFKRFFFSRFRLFISSCSCNNQQRARKKMRHINCTPWNTLIM